MCRWDDAALVYDVRVGSGLDTDLVLRHYSFADRWFMANCTLNLRGESVTEPGPIDWCFNCDVSTPLFTVGRHVLNVDLCLDVLVAPNGRDRHIEDQEEFDDSVAAAPIPPPMLRRRLDEFPLLRPAMRGRYFGQRWSDGDR